MLAAEMGDKQLVALLLADGANVDSIDSVGNTPLHWAATGGNLEVAELMIARKLNVDVKNNAGQTPLHLAIKGPDPPLNRGRHQYCSVVNMLLANHADINAQDDEGRTPLHYSIRFGALARLLLKKGADPSIRDRSGETPLDLAESKFSRGRVRYYDPQKVDPAVPYLLGVPDDGAIPVSRYGADPACN
jgi:ankyrin repeat protein